MLISHLFYARLVCRNRANELRIINRFSILKSAKSDKLQTYHSGRSQPHKLPFFTFDLQTNSTTRHNHIRKTGAHKKSTITLRQSVLASAIQDTSICEEVSFYVKFFCARFSPIAHNKNRDIRQAILQIKTCTSRT